MALVGCGKKTTPSEPEANAEPKVEANKPEPPKTEPKTEAKIPANAFVNTLGMSFVPVPGTEVQFCIWETRMKDYAAYAAANAGVDGTWKQPGFHPDPVTTGFQQADTHPVVNVSWNDAQAFCAWLTKKELAEGKIKAGQKYRLPTDAEWSVAVGLGKEKGNTPGEKHRGIKGVYPWGKGYPPPVEAGNYNKSLKVDKFEYTAPVGSFAANKLGLHDMGGNVWEWCEDKYSPTSTRRVLRGASWGIVYPDGLLSSYRDDFTPDLRFYYFGFRCVLVGGSGG
jgi:formylglycine-generating enzyme required for sulfatase activity